MRLAGFVAPGSLPVLGRQLAPWDRAFGVTQLASCFADGVGRPIAKIGTRAETPRTASAAAIVAADTVANPINTAYRRPMSEILRALCGEALDKKKFVTQGNAARTALKHLPISPGGM